ncbi:MAG: CHAD domain-containing protein [Pirellulales bacterium]
MAFRFKPGEPVSRAVTRIAREQIDGALAALKLDAEPAPEAVHDARKRFKRVRALLRLVREPLGRKVFKRENRVFRGAGRPLSSVRDAKVLIEALDKLAGSAEDGHPAEWSALRAALVERQQALSSGVLSDHELRDGIVESLEQERKRAKEWLADPWVQKREGWPLVEAGLKRAYKQGRKALGAVRSDPTTERLHEWRKRVKDLWHQLQLFAPMERDVLGNKVRETHQLADLLGDDHDLAVLAQVIEKDPNCLAAAKAIDNLASLIAGRRAELQAQALALGEQVFADKPRQFVDTLEDYWHSWQCAAGEAARCG